ncbi:MAG: hypothetical protein OEY87_05805 [Gammaproteobacteria bacterium]|nr:hypothetical protein [Gammaproteobacteria bacterium]MDH5735621.1 hypothetical protein [Gammaproteobacteria bacterium]
MFLRLYFLLPNEELTQRLIPELVQHGVSKNNIHAIVRNKTTDISLPETNKWQKKDFSHQLENFAWNSNLAIFFLAFLSLALCLWFDMKIPAILSIVVMAITFIVGDLFAMLIPKVHLDEFEHALSHGEVLLMVDTLKKNSATIENMVSKHHPAAIAGGSCWTLNAYGI